MFFCVCYYLRFKCMSISQSALVKCPGEYCVTSLSFGMEFFFFKLFCLSSVVTLGSMKTVVESRHQTAGEASGPISLCALL